MQTFAHTQEFTHSHSSPLSYSLLTTRWQYSSLLLAFCQGLLLPLSSSPPANFIIIMFLIIPESQRKRHAVLHFLGRRVQRRFWHRLQSERRLLTTVSARSDGITQRGECEVVCVCMCVWRWAHMQTKYPHNDRSQDVFHILISLRSLSGLGYLDWIIRESRK